MKKLFTFFFVMILAFAIGCGKTDKTDKTETKKDEKKTEFVSGFACKIDGKDITFADSLCNFSKDDKSFSVYALIDVEGGQYDDFFFYIETPMKTGDFALSKENNPGHAQYRTNKNKPADAEYVQFWSDEGKVTVAKFDDKTSEGTFNFTASGENPDGSPKKISITDGKFKITHK